MKKQKFLQLFTVFSVIALSAVAKPAHANWVDDILGGIGGALISAISSLLAIVADVLSWIFFDLILGPILGLVLDNTNILINHPVAQSIWNGSLMVANGLFLLALVIASVAIILRLNTGMYNIKKILSGFITAVILSNLSLLVVRVLVEFGDNLNIAVFRLFETISSGTLSQSTITGSDSYIMALASIDAPILLPATSLDAGVGQFIAVIFAIFMMVLMFWILLKLTLILLERMFWIFIMAVSAPIVFALGLLPTTQKLVGDWWSKLIKWILVLPLITALLNIAVYLFIKVVETVNPSPPASVATSPITILATDNPLSPAQEFVNQLLDKDFVIGLFTHTDPDGKPTGIGLLFIAGLIILYQAGRASNFLKIDSVISGIVDTPKAAGQLASKIIGKPAKSAITGVNRLAGSGKLGSGIQKLVTKGAASRKRQTGAWGMVVNPKGRAEILDVDIKNAGAKELVRQTANSLSNTHRNLNTITRKNNNGKSWDDMTPEEQDDAKQKTPKVKKLAEQSKNLRGSLMYHARNIAHQTKPEDLGIPEEYNRILKNDKSTKGERTIAAIQLKRIASRKTNEGYEEAKAALNEPSNIATLKNDGLSISSLPLPSDIPSDSSDTKKENGRDTTTSAEATVSMISYMQAGQEIKKLEKLLNSLGSTDIGALQMVQTYHEMKHDNPEAKAKAEENLRKTLKTLGIENKKEQDVIIDTAKSPAVGKALKNSTKNNPLNKRYSRTTTRLEDTIQTLSGAQESASISAQVKATRNSTITNAQKIIVDQVDGGVMSEENVSTLNSDTQAALDKLMQAVGDDPDIKDSSKLSSLNLSEEVLKDIQNSFNNSGLVTGQNLDKISQISNASINDIIGHLDIVNQATTKGYEKNYGY